MANQLSLEEVQHVARLARLELAEAEQRQMTEQLNAILGYMEKLNELDTGAIEPMTHAAPITNVFREDRRQPSLARELALANAPDSDGANFVVPKVI
ncbi:MAG: asparaginyl/glutamyl-tRNA amidotransferase subunit C [Syntrophobacteraceae bacterium CG2_30_61_12]|nr:MAG: asparaginyl/glutamyl-tRNA amidotransferase subunit C [Syntrophobacteraceae bacterium CG2_30_61_12]PIU32115.1 MAG: Asp-tRNA(Asn)/Glu-tRNA(Gln) amidotransferase GatCAB subunit C [Syntrophobacteraceae bacterium CG07_land_8_20_14_0_80_61_8]